MQLLTLITRLRESGVSLSLSNSQLVCKFPKGWDQPELKKALIEQKEEIKDVLRNANSGTKNAQSLDDFLHLEVKNNAKSNDRQAPRALSSEELRLWYLDEVEQVGAANNMPLQIFKFTGKLDIAQLAKALHLIVMRHESLRTVYRSEKGQPQAVVQEANAHKLITLQSSPEVFNLVELVESENARRFNLSTGPLFQCTLVDLNCEEYVLVIAKHHIISDGWSVNILVSELAELYTQLVDGSALDIEPLKAQYREYEGAQSKWLLSSDGKEKLKFWQQTLEDMPENLDLPTDHISSLEAGNGSGSIDAKLSAEKLEKLKAYCKNQKITSFVFLLGTFNILLSKLSDRQDFIVGCANGSRHAAYLDHMIGCFINHLLIRQPIDCEATVADYYQALKMLTYSAFENQQIPYECLQDIAIKQGSSQSKLFNIYFNYLNYPTAAPTLSGLEIEQLNLEQQASKFDITLYIEESDNGLEISFNFNSNKFKAERIACMMEQYLHLLSHISESSNQAINTLCLPSEEAPYQPLEVPHQDSVIVTQLMQRFEQHSQKTALSDDDRQLSYQSLGHCVDNFANDLMAQQVGKGDVVAIVTDRQLELVPAILGILKAGAAFCLLPNSLPSGMMSDCLQVAKASHITSLISDVDVSGLIANADVQQIEFMLNDTELSEAPQWPHVDINDVAYIAFTSGTTGASKAIMGGHASLATMFEGQIEKFGITSDDNAALLSGLGHDPMHRDIFLPLLAGAQLFIPPCAAYDIDTLRPWLNRCGISMLNLTPTLANALAGDAPESLASLNAMMLAGEPLSAQTVSQLRHYVPNAKLFNLYGATETQQALAVYEIPLEYSQGGDVVPLAQQLQGVSIKVLNSEGLPCGVGEIGNIWIESPFIAHGYLDGQSSGGFELSNDGKKRYKTGDIGRYNLDGTIQYCGRHDRQLKIRGYRIEPSAIENEVMMFSQVSACHVLVHKEAQDNLVAFIKYAKCSDVTENLISDIMAHLKAQLSSVCVPSEVVVVEQWPLTKNGKLDQEKLWQQYGQNAKPLDMTPAEGEVELSLQRIWGELLNSNSDIGAEQDFFEIGGHSLLAVKLVAKIGAQFDVQLSVADIFHYPTIRALAGKIETASEATVLPPIQRIAEDVAVPLAHTQERIWFIDELKGGAAEYNIAFSFKVTGEFDISLAEMALKKIIERHDILKTIYYVDEGIPYQKVRSAQSFKITTSELDIKDGSVENLLYDKVAEFKAKPFDLSRDLLIKADLIMLNQQPVQMQSIFTIVVHHIATDGWSMALLWSEFKEIYGQLSRQEALYLPEVSHQFSDYAHWQRGLDKTLLDKELTYWKKQLTQAPALHSIPLDFERTAEKSNVAAKLEFKLDQEVSSRLVQFARTKKITPFVLVHSILSLVVSRNSNQQDIVIGTPVANRHHTCLDNTIGFFANTLALKVNTNIETVDEYIAHVKQVNIEAQSNQNVPFDMLVDALEVARSAAYNPVFQIVLAMNNIELENLSLDGLNIEELPENYKTALFDLDFNCWFEDDCWAFSLVYDSGLFTSDKASSILEQLKTGLTSIVTENATRLRDVNILSEAQLTELIVQPTESRVTVEHSITPIEQFTQQAGLFPNKVALIHANQTLSYAQVNEHATQLACHLKSLGIEAKEKIGIVVNRNARSVIAILAALKLGVTFIPLDPKAPVERLKYQANDAQLARIIVCDDNVSEDTLDFGEDYLLYDEALMRHLEANHYDTKVLNYQPMPEDDAYIIYTSGSTGAPKGIPQSNYNLLRLFEVTEADFSFNDQDVWLLFHSLAFDFSVWEMWGALLFGGTLVIPEHENLLDPAVLSELCITNKVSVLNQTPSAFSNFAHYAVENQLSFPQLRYIIFGGEALKSDSIVNWVSFFGDNKPQLVNMYGITEITVHGTIKKLKRHELDNGSIGHSLKDQTFYLLDEQLAPVPKGAVGEICIAGAGLAKGYLGLPEVTQRQFVDNPYGQVKEKIYRSGDLARYLDNGELQYMGRKDSQVKLRGFRIELLEIERKILAVEGVVDAFVRVVESANKIENIAAYVVCSAEIDHETWTAKLREALSDSLPSYMVPTFFAILDNLPKNINGKIDTAKLPAIESTEMAKGFRVPVTQEEKWVAQATAKVLGVETSAINLNVGFFELGGNSLLAIRMLAELSALSGIQVTITEFLNITELGDVAKFVEAEIELLDLQTQLAQGEIKGEGVL
ncbi:non-ribosomal peptide synthetase [Pseudoalteromonas umbrosa]|uniref:non-ribosomal peptide synthetase n=1 Tax=Pseudoalteromonas umbrosa TaxID=3048489 RepID=UPI0024C21E40|nr:non-ribosomal peptide synthetase [Pseudoalteromonas sp. B95]MDK1288849.1 amino acid adenylation domain-containing protein [Pseudoalteromonas sp. B95]